MTKLETEHEELREYAEKAKLELEEVSQELVLAHSAQDALTKVVMDVCKGREPTDVMWLKSQPPRSNV